VDTCLGPAVRSYGQGEVLSVAAHIKNTAGLTNTLDTEMISTCSFVLKQIMPYYDKYTAPYFQGIDYDVVDHGMPGGATSSSQEGAMKQGYIHLLPYMLKFLGGVRRIVRYHDVTPGSQITWNTSFLAVTGAYKRGGEVAVRKLLTILDMVNTVPEEQFTDLEKQARLTLYRDCNDAFRNLLLGRFGRLPLGFPPDWVYQSAFGEGWEEAIANRTEESPLASLEDVDVESERADLAAKLNRQPHDDELLMYLNHPGDALKCIDQTERYGDPNNLPLDVWFEGLERGASASFTDDHGKPHQFLFLDVTAPDDEGMCTVHFELDHEIVQHQVKVAERKGHAVGALEMADPSNPGHVAAPSNGDLWIMHVKQGQKVTRGEEIFNLSIMKQEKAVLAPISGTVARVLKNADYTNDRKMVPVKEGELLVEITPLPAC
jgi:pyruvate carboxylase